MPMRQLNIHNTLLRTESRHVARLPTSRTHEYVCKLRYPWLPDSLRAQRVRHKFVWNGFLALFRKAYLPISISPFTIKGKIIKPGPLKKGMSPALTYPEPALLKLSVVALTTFVLDSEPTGNCVEVDVVGAQGMLGKIFTDAAVAEEFFAGACYFHGCCSLSQT